MVTIKKIITMIANMNFLFGHLEVLGYLVS